MLPLALMQRQSADAMNRFGLGLLKLWERHDPRLLELRIDQRPVIHLERFQFQFKRLIGFG